MEALIQALFKLLNSRGFFLEKLPMPEDTHFFKDGEQYTKVNNGVYKGTLWKYCKPCDDFFPWIKNKEEDCPYCKEKSNV